MRHFKHEIVLLLLLLLFIIINFFFIIVVLAFACVCTTAITLQARIHQKRFTPFTLITTLHGETSPTLPATVNDVFESIPNACTF